MHRIVSHTLSIRGKSVYLIAKAFENYCFPQNPQLPFNSKTVITAYIIPAQFNAVKMKNAEEGGVAGFFSRARWGPGSIVFIIMLLTLAISLLIIGKGRGIFIAEAAVIFFLVIAFVLVKRGERISVTPAKPSSPGGYKESQCKTALKGG